MYEFDPLVRLSWFVAAAAPSTVAPAPAGPALTPAPPPIVSMEPGMGSLFGPAQSDAQQIPHNSSLTDTWYFGAGATFMNSNTQAELSSTAGVGAVIDFENAFGLAENQVTPELMARWRFSERWRLEFEYFSLNRSNSRTTLNDLTWGDLPTIPAGTNVKGTFDVSVLRVSCGYSFFKTQDKELGVALGFHLTKFEAALDAGGVIGEQESKVLAPLPVVSMYGQFALTDDWAIQGRLDALRLEYDPFHGNVLSIGVDALYQAWRHWGFGLGWRTLQVAGGVSSSDWEGEISTTYTGPVLFVTSSF